VSRRTARVPASTPDSRQRLEPTESRSLLCDVARCSSMCLVSYAGVGVGGVLCARWCLSLRVDSGG
jgi:hypothetical protein